MKQIALPCAFSRRDYYDKTTHLWSAVGWLLRSFMGVSREQAGDRRLVVRCERMLMAYLEVAQSDLMDLEETVDRIAAPGQQRAIFSDWCTRHGIQIAKGTER